jgi:hypothetical protein
LTVPIGYTVAASGSTNICRIHSANPSGHARKIFASQRADDKRSGSSIPALNPLNHECNANVDADEAMVETFMHAATIRAAF